MHIIKANSCIRHMGAVCFPSCLGLYSSTEAAVVSIEAGLLLQNLAADVFFIYLFLSS